MKKKRESLDSVGENPSSCESMTLDSENINLNIINEPYRKKLKEAFFSITNLKFLIFCFCGFCKYYIYYLISS